jgi:hypothetical protein
VINSLEKRRREKRLDKNRSSKASKGRQLSGAQLETLDCGVMKKVFPFNSLSMAIDPFMLRTKPSLLFGLLSYLGKKADRNSNSEDRNSEGTVFCNKRKKFVNK